MIDDTVRINLVVGDDVPSMLTELAGGERKRGDYVTTLIRAVHAGERESVGGAERELRQLTVTGLAAKTMMLEARLAQVELQLAAVMADG